jgi:hypothetical protein
MYWESLATAALLFSALTPPPARAQGTGGPTVVDSAVGYIDSAIPGNLFRLRYDAAFDNHAPNRAEFFWPKGQPLGPGVPKPETAVNYQELNGYLEGLLTERLSVFADVPWRFLNPEVNANTNGLSDVSAGFKWAFAYSDDGVGTFQFQTYAPTGDAQRGLGTRHVSLEPAFLFYKPLTDRLHLEGELRDFVPVGGTDFAGDVLRYGLGINYEFFETSHIKVVPVTEFVGWTVLSGKESIAEPGGPVVIQHVAGETILNIKVGVYFKLSDTADIYTGYGRPLTGDRWYDNFFRLQFRLFF